MDLGLVINSNLNCKNHLETKISKAHKVYQMIRRNSASHTSTQSILYMMDFPLLTAGFLLSVESGHSHSASVTKTNEAPSANDIFIEY